jgi:CHAT domain-containing protein
LACLASTVGSAPQESAGDLQKRAIARIDSFVEHFRRTGDMRSLLPQLADADRELTASNTQFAALGDWSALSLGLIKQGSIYRMQGQWSPAIHLYTEAVGAAVRARDVTRQTDALAWRALAESSARNVGEALADASEAVRLGETISDKDVLARALDVLGTVQLAQRDLAGAAQSLNREVDIALQGKDPMGPYFAYLNRSDIYLKTADKCDYSQAFDACYEALDKARADLQQALRIVRGFGYSALVQQTEQFLSNLEVRRAMIGSRERTQGVLQKTSVFHPKSVSDVLVTDRYVTRPAQIPEPLQALYQQSVQDRKRVGGFADVTQATALYTEGLMNEMQGTNDAALSSYMRAVDVLEHDRRSLRDEKSRGTFLEDRIGIYYAPILHLLERHQYDKAFQLLERSRSRALSDLLATRKLSLNQPQEQKLYAQAELLRTQIADGQSKLFELASGTEAAANPTRLTALQGQIHSLEEQDHQLSARMQREAPRLGNLVSSTPVTLAELQASMRTEHYEVLEYLVLDTALVVWHITADSVLVRNVFLPRSELMVKVAALQKSLSDRNASFEEGTAKELFLYLVAPVSSHVRGSRLVIIPHEDLQYVPFEVLQDPADGHFLGEGFQISYAPSASVLLGMKASQPLSGGRLLAVADPSIAAAPAEVLAIAKFFPGTRKLVTDTLSSESDVKGWVGAYDVVHLSVHGKFSASEPMLSYLSLGRDANNDGRLTAAEMFGLPLGNSRVVVLSACETGRAQATHANEILGMVRGLIYAGAGALVMSHWQVDSDATALWMQTFYEAAQSRGLPEATRLALLKVKSVPSFRHPYYWAAFTLVGR